MCERTANCECEYDVNDGDPLNFGFEFEPKGNFTFTYNGAKSTAFVAPLCSPHFFVMKELVRRTHYLAIPKFVDMSEVVNVNGEVIGPYFSALYRNETDLVLLDTPLTQSMFSFVKTTPRLDLEHMFCILGTIYPVPLRDTFFGALKIFDYLIWLILLLILLLMPLFLLVDKILLMQKFKNCLQNYFSEIWLLFSSSFLGIEFRAERKFLSYGSFLLMTTIIIDAFSSGILFSTIHISYTYIDSIEDLMERPDMKPFVHYSEERINEIRKYGTEDMNRYLDLGLNFTEPEAVSNYATLFARKEKLIKLIINAKTHVFISAQTQVNIMETAISETRSKVTHISRTRYLPYFVGYVRNKYTEPLIGDTYEKILYELQESGCYHKFAHDIVEVASHFFDSKKQKTVTHEEKVDRFVVQIKIALGPLITGIHISVLSIFIEKSIDYRLRKINFS